MRDVKGKAAVIPTPHQPRHVGIMISALALLSIGWIMVTSASSDIMSSNPYYYCVRHGCFVLLSIVGALVVMRVPMTWWRAKGPTLFIIAVVLLLAVLGVGRTVNGAKRWIGLGMLNLQTSEVAKICMVVYLSSYMVRHLERVRTTWQGFMAPLALSSVLALLLLLEPDYGATVVLLSCTMGMLLLAGAAAHRFLLLLVVMVGLGVLMVIIEPYRMQRVTSFLDPWANQFDSGYQLTQALIAFGRGGWFGMGLGNSVQKLQYLPEAHTDFVFSVLAEELGLFGSIVVVVLFIILVWNAFSVGREAECSGRFFSAYICYGCGMILGAQACINIAVNVGLMPTKGLTLPLLSYGGSSLMVFGAMIGLLLRVDGETRAYKAARGRPGRRSPEAVKEASA